MPSMQLSNHENVDAKKLQSVESIIPRIGLLTSYLDNVKSMNTLTAVQYKSELNSFIKFVYDTYGCDVDTLISMIIKNDRRQKKTNIDPYDVLSRYTAFLVGTIAPVTIKHSIIIFITRIYLNLLCTTNKI
jgi:hypothetical protein